MTHPTCAQNQTMNEPRPDTFGENYRKGRLIPRICGKDLMVFGAMVAHFGREQGEGVLEALSWVLLNRWAAGDGVGAVAIELSHQTSEWAASLLADPVDPDRARALGVFARVVAGGINDPTDGATRFHYHDETPGWAENMDIRAIIGPYLFYAPHLKF